MAKYVLAKGEKADKNTVRVQDYVIARLYMVKEEKGYIDNTNTDNQMDFIGYETRNLDQIGDIIVKNSLAIKGHIPTKAEEFLTGTKFELLSFQQNVIKTRLVSRVSARELDTFVYLFLDHHPTVEQLWKYIQEHENVEEYREQLEELKKQGLANHQQAKINEKLKAEEEERERLSIRRIS